MPKTAARKRAAFEILGLDHLVLRATDPARLKRFYCDVLGCTLERERPELGLTQLRAGVSLIDLISVEGELGKAGGAAPGKTRRNMDHLCLRIEPFDQNALVAHLVSNGIAVGEIKSRFGADGYGPSLYISDPEGNVIELKGPPTRAGRN
jgi:glyoxylase I family protein